MYLAENLIDFSGDFISKDFDFLARHFRCVWVKIQSVTYVFEWKFSQLLMCLSDCKFRGDNYNVSTKMGTRFIHKAINFNKYFENFAKKISFSFYGALCRKTICVGLCNLFLCDVLLTVIHVCYFGEVFSPYCFSLNSEWVLRPLVTLVHLSLAYSASSEQINPVVSTPPLNNAIVNF